MSSIPTFRRLPLGPLAAALCLAAALQPAAAQETKITLGMSGWTGFAPLTLADKDRKSTRLNSSHLVISYAVFCLKKKKKKNKKLKSKHVQSHYTIHYITFV